MEKLARRISKLAEKSQARLLEESRKLHDMLIEFSNNRVAVRRAGLEHAVRRPAAQRDPLIIVAPVARSLISQGRGVPRPGYNLMEVTDIFCVD